MIFTVDSSEAGTGQKVSLRCPVCKKLGIFDPVGIDQTIQKDLGKMKFELFKAGHRRCPNPACHSHIFVVLDGLTVLISYPPELIDFDFTNLPTAVVKALAEAIFCHSNQCFTAAAMMVRKTLEEICENHKAKGANLKERIQKLATKVVLPAELFDGLHDIRLLGNDAAHIKSRDYDNIGKDEVEVAIEFTQEVLKALYQYSELLKKLKSLKANSDVT